MRVRPAAPPPNAAEHDDAEQHRLTALEGLAALSLDALSSVAYGPEAIVIVLAAAGTAGLAYTLPVTLAIVVLLAVLVISYRQVIAAFPGGGGAYAVAGRHLGRMPSLIAAASLIVDYVLNAAVGVSAGVAALTSAFPALYGDRVWLCLGVLAVITAANLWGVAESARIFIVPTVIFILAIAVVIVGGLLRSHPAVPLGGHLPQTTETVGILLLLKAFASGCSALTGVEAIANAVPEFRQPRARRAQHTEMWLGIILGLMLIGIAILIRKFHAVPSPTETTLAQLTAAAVGHNVVFYAIQLITTVLLALAANTSFGGLPVLASLLARDNYLPHVFALKGERQVFRYGVIVLARPGGGAAGGGQGRHAGPDPGVRHRGVRRVHPLPGRHGPALARAARCGLAPAGVHQRAGRGAHHRRAGHRAGQQVHRGGLAGRHRRPAAGADVHPDQCGVSAHRRAARAG